MSGDFYTDAEVDEMCDGLEQNAAKIRYLRTVYKLRVDKKPSGRPLVWKPAPAEPDGQVQNEPASAGSVVFDLQQWAKDRRGQKTQGR